MPLRLAFDLDGVFADMEGELARQADILFGHRRPATSDSPDVPSGGPGNDASRPAGLEQTLPAEQSNESSQGDEPALPRLELSARRLHRLWEHVEQIENFWETLREIEPGSVARLSRIARERRWEVIFLTRRPATAGATGQMQSQRWLQAKGFELPSVFVVQGSRGRIAASLGLDLVVDDTPENCFDVVVDSKARAVLVWRHQEPAPASARRLGIGVTGSVGECLDVLSQVEDASAKPGVMTRIMRLLGLKEPAGA